VRSRVFRQFHRHRVETTSEKFFVAYQPKRQPINCRTQGSEREAGGGHGAARDLGQDPLKRQHASANDKEAMRARIA
jgi:hypothetical protein